MKSRVMLFFITSFKKRCVSIKNISIIVIFVFIFATSIQAQPQCSATFNPFNSCYYSTQPQIVFFGRVISTESIQNGFDQSNFKATIEIEEDLRGKSPKKVNVYLAKGCNSFVRNNEKYIFFAEKKITNNNSYLFSERWSYPIGNYSKSGMKEIFSIAKSYLKKEVRNEVSGVVILGLGKEKNVRNDAETIAKLNYNPYHYNPMMGITIEAKRTEDGKVFKTITNKDGYYNFNYLPKGIYRITPILPIGFTGTYYDAGIGDGRCYWKKVSEIINLARF